MHSFVKRHKQLIILIALINFILSPLWHDLMFIPNSLLTVISFSLVIFASLNASEERILKIIVLAIGWTALGIIWLEYGNHLALPLSVIRMFFSLLLFIVLFSILIRSVLKTEKIHLKIIINVMSGFILLGIVGGICFEILDFFAPDSLAFASPKTAYGFYYFSFINLTSVGFGDIIPNSPKAQALTVLLGVTGQFYLAFGVAVFVGKYLSHKNEHA